MKNQLLILLCILGLLHVGNSQGDQQWMVNDGHGKSDYVGGHNVFSSAVVGDTVTLQAIRHADVINYPSRRNDVFVIYDDFTYYNTRNITSVGGLFSTGDLNQFNHTLTSPSGRTIQYMYLTNIYEGDDPPDAVRALSGQSGPSDSYPLVNSSLTTGIDATHNVIPDRDITLIIDKTVLNPSGGSFLQMDMMDMSGNIIPMNPPSQYFVASPIFQGTNFSNYSGLTVTSNTINLPRPQDISAPFLYINLKPTTAIIFPSNPSGPAEFQIMFSILGNGHMVYRKPEQILNSYDPNFIEIKSICQYKSIQIINYHLQFQNTGDAATNSMSVKLKLPGEVEPECIGSLVFKVGDVTVNGELQFKGQEVKFIFNNEMPLNFCAPGADPIKTRCIGSVDFCVRVKKNYRKLIQNPLNASLEPKDTFITFGTTEYSLQGFRDHSIKVEGGHSFRKIDNENPCACNCEN